MTTPAPVDAPAATIDVWTVPLSVPASVVAGERTLLSPAERNRADRYRTEQDRRTFTLVRAALRRRLGLQLDAAPHRLRLAEQPSGKPYLPDLDLAFNVAHSGDLGLIALAPLQEVGIDLEQLPAPIDTGVIDLVCAPEERDHLQTLAPAARRRALLRLWVRKEAVLKCSGQGLRCDPRSQPVLCDVVGPRRVADLDIGKDYMAAVCAPSGGWAVSLNTPTCA